LKPALDGIRILDLSRLPPCALCTMILSDMGADVLKVQATPEAGERAGASFGDFTPIDGDKEGRRQAAYYALNRNKRSIGLNLKTEKGRQIFYKLVEQADVIVEGFRPGAVDRLGIGYEKIKEVNPRIIYCSISGYGQDGPYHQMAGHDITYVSTGGALGIIGEKDGPPIVPWNFVGDMAGGALQAAVGILIAIVNRDKTGTGQHVDISMTDGVVTMMAFELFNYFYTDQIPRRGENVIGGSNPEYGVYPTKDGKFLSIGCIEPWFWKNLCHALGREDLIPYQNAGDVKLQEVKSELQKIFLTRTRDEWFEKLIKENIPAGKVYDLDEVVRDPQIEHRKMVVELQHPEFGSIKQVGIGIKLSKTPGKIRSFSPVFGEHTNTTLAGLGYSPEDIISLRKEGIIG
jgi:crotonobetainyl-CoA:carnitine CoA-transferase CaiB-like acyl-CoA transferase